MDQHYSLIIPPKDFSSFKEDLKTRNYSKYLHLPISTLFAAVLDVHFDEISDSDIKFFLHHNLNINRESSAYDLKSPFKYACSFRLSNLLKLLIENNLNVNISSEAPYPLDLVLLGHPETEEGDLSEVEECVKILEKEGISNKISFCVPAELLNEIRMFSPYLKNFLNL